jgi:FkbM family methyltransferase
MSIKANVVKLVARGAVAGPWRGAAESLTCAIGRRFPSNRITLSFCRHMGSQLLEREGSKFERVACFSSGGKMSCTGLNGISTTGIMYYFLGTINGQTEDERPIEKLLLRAIRPGDTFLDIGANYGFYSFLLGPLCGKSGSVHAFEANPILIQHLMRSAELNQASANITINNVAIGSTKRNAVILYDPERIGCSSLHQHEWVDTKKSVCVRQITIDDYRRSSAISKIDVIKIDIEGAELEAFRGMEETFDVARPQLIVCELMPLVNTTADAANRVGNLRRASSAANPVEIVDFLSARGYEARYLQESDGRLGEIAGRNQIERLSQTVINLGFIRQDLRTTRPDLFAKP